jgi:hypothetical protein
MKKESTPFAILEIKDNSGIWAKFYWSANSGTYGHQVIVEYNKDGNSFKTYKTNGCGFCKSTAALEHVIKEITGQYKSLGGDLKYWLGRSEHFQGGNHFTIKTVKDLLILDKIRD